MILLNINLLRILIGGLGMTMIKTLLGDSSTASTAELRTLISAEAGRVACPTSCQSCSQSPRYPCPAVERPTRSSGGKRSAMTGFLDFRSYCASQADHSIPEVLVGRSTAGWVTRTLGTRLTSCLTQAVDEVVGLGIKLIIYLTFTFI